MCDAIAGEIILGYNAEDPIGSELIESVWKIPGLEIEESAHDRLSRMQFEVTFPLRFHLIRTEVGEENRGMAILHDQYRRILGRRLERRELRLRDVARFSPSVSPNSVLSTAQTPPTSSPFDFSVTHTQYKAMFGWVPNQTAHTPRRVAVLDSGIAKSLTQKVQIASERNFVNRSQEFDADDDHPYFHGSAMAAIISDVCPDATISVFKVVDSKDRASEWDLLCALVSSADADIINISLQYGLPDKECGTCGRQSHSSRSEVLERAFAALKGPVVVAAAGNWGKPELAFPARFRSTLAIASIDSSGALSTFSNRSTVGHDQSFHDNVFVLPGGEQAKPQPPTEYVGEAPQKQHVGTSFAAAYASGIIAAVWSRPAHATKSRDEIIAYLRSTADDTVTGFDPATYGNGMMKF